MTRMLDACVVLLIIIYGESVMSSPLGINAIWNKVSKLSPEKLECVLRVVQQGVECQDIFTVLHQSNYEDQIIEKLSANNCYSFIVRTPKFQSWLLRPEAYIILVKNVSDFIEITDKVSKNFGWNAVARFFIVIHNFENVQYLELFKVFAKLNMYHVQVIVSNMTDETFVYTYNPFDKKRCGRVDKDIIKIHPCKGFIHNELNETEIENQIRSCPIAVIAKENPPNVIFKTNKKFLYHSISQVGIEQYMLINIAKKEKYRFYSISLRNIMSNYKNEEECSDLLQKLAKHPLSISIGGYLLIKNGSDCFDFIWGYCYSNFKIYTHIRDVKHWKKVYREFGTTTWVLIALSYCSVTILSIIIYKISVRKVNKKYLALKIWGYLNSRSDKELIKIRKLRVILIIWIWFSFFIINFYNTAFFTLLTAPVDRGMIVKPEKLFSSSLKPCISNEDRLWIKLSLNVTIPSLSDEECENDETALDAVAKNKELYTLISEPTHYKREYKYLDKFGHPKLDRWLFGTGDIAFTVITNRGFPLLQKFQRYASYHFESGLLLKHTKDLNHYFVLFREFKPFTLADFKIHFAILFVGYFISFIAYIVETNHLHT